MNAFANDASKPVNLDAYGAPLLLVAACFAMALAVAPQPGSTTTDFLIFHQSGHQFLNGADPYFPFVAHRGPNLNPPWVVAMMAPLSMAALSTAVVVWWVISFACFFASMALIAHTLRQLDIVALASAVLVTQAAFANVRLGQVAWPIMLLITAAWHAQRRGRAVRCGACLGMAVSWKPFLLVFIALLVWQRQWRGVVTAVAVAVGLFALGWFIAGSSTFRSWLAVLQLVGWEELLLNTSGRALIGRALTLPSLIEAHTTPLIVAPRYVPAAWSVIIGLLCGAAAVRLSRTGNVDVAWAALGLLALLVSPIGWVHYVPIVSGPLAGALLADRSTRYGVAIVGWSVLCIPYEWLKGATFGPLLTVTVASSGTGGEPCCC